MPLKLAYSIALNRLRIVGWANRPIWWGGMTAEISQLISSIPFIYLIIFSSAKLMPFPNDMNEN